MGVRFNLVGFCILIVMYHFINEKFHFLKINPNIDFESKQNIFINAVKLYKSNPLEFELELITEGAYFLNNLKILYLRH